MNLASWLFFSITRFEPFSVITRSSLGRLNAAVWTPRLASPDENTVLTTRMGAMGPQLRVAEFRIDRQVVFDLLELGSEARQLLRLHIVAQRDERLERGLVVEPLIFVGLVRPDRRLDAGVEPHPGDVAVVVVVAEERGGALFEKALQGRLGGERRRLSEQRCSRARSRLDTRASTAPP